MTTYKTTVSCMKIIKQILKNNIDINVKDYNGRTALSLCCTKNASTMDIIDLLLENNKDTIKYINKIRMSANKMQYDKNNFNIAKLLIENSADINTQDKNGKTPLILCCSCEYYNIEIIKLLLDNNADVNMPMLCWDNKGRNALMYISWIHIVSV